MNKLKNRIVIFFARITTLAFLFYRIFPYFFRLKWNFNNDDLNEGVVIYALKNIKIASLGGITWTDKKEIDDLKDIIREYLRFNDSCLIANTNKSIFKSVLFYLNSDKDFQTIRSHYYQIIQYLNNVYEKIHNDEKLIFFNDLFLEYKLESSFRESLESYLESVEIIKGYDELTEKRKFLKKYYKKQDKILSLKFSRKVDISKTNISVFLSVFTILTFLTGYFYYSILLNSIGIDVSKYFSISDYISSSVSLIRFSLLGAIMALSSHYLALRKYSFGSEWDSKLKYNSTNISMSIIIGVIGIVLLLLLSLIRGITYEQIEPIAILFLIIWSYTIADWLAKRLFYNYFISYLIIAFILVYFGYLGIKTTRDLYAIRNNDFKASEKVIFEEQLPSETNNWIMITSNSNYCFFRDTVLNKSYVVPLSNVKLIKIE